MELGKGGPIKRRSPLLGDKPDYSKALYTDPPSHDFCHWLIMAELMRRHHGADGPLKVRFLFQNGLLGKYDYGPHGILDGRAHAGVNSLEYSNMMVTHVLRPAIEMIGAINEPDLHVPIKLEEVGEYCEYDYHFWQLVDAGRSGYELPIWQVPKWAKKEVSEFLKGDVPIVVTLRETPCQVERNSNFQEWFKFGEYLQRRGFSVVFVRDTHSINFPLPFRTWWRASSDTYVRAALMQAALCNLTTCGGPVAWIIHSKVPYLIFKQLVPEIPAWDGGQPKGWREQCHLEVGDQIPWAMPQQRMTWTADTFENIRNEFEAFLDDSSIRATG